MTARALKSTFQGAITSRQTFSATNLADTTGLLTVNMAEHCQKINLQITGIRKAAKNDYKKIKYLMSQLETLKTFSDILEKFKFRKI